MTREQEQAPVYYYVITAVDQVGNESAASAEKNALIEKLQQ